MDRILAIVIAAVAASAVALQFYVLRQQTPSTDTVRIIWLMAGYFTILTNLLVLAVMALVATRRPVSARRIGGVTLSMIIVGLLYHAILARLWNPQGLAMLADQGLHSVVPVLMVIWWGLYAPKSALNWDDVAAWLVWPLIYLGYALARQVLTGFVAYPFLDLHTLGAIEVARNVLTIVGLFVVCAAAMLGVARLSRR